jgi:hypothetical protein
VRAQVGWIPHAGRRIPWLYQRVSPRQRRWLRHGILRLRSARLTASAPLRMTPILEPSRLRRYFCFSFRSSGVGNVIGIPHPGFASKAEADSAELVALPVGVGDRLPLLWARNRPGDGEHFPFKPERGRVAIFAALVRTEFPPRSVGGWSHVEQQHRLLRAKPQVLQSQCLFDGGPAECVVKSCRATTGIAWLPGACFLEDDNSRGWFGHRNAAISDSIPSCGRSRACMKPERPHPSQLGEYFVDR